MYKENTESISAAMRGNRTACACNENLGRGNERLYLLDASFVYCLIASRVSYEDTRRIYIGSVSDAVGNVFVKRFCKFAAVLLADSHFAVFYHDAGFDLQKKSAERRYRGATSALM